MRGVVISLFLLAVLVLPANGQIRTADYRAYEAYRTAVGAPRLLSSEPGNSRLLTDAQFAGQLGAGTTLLGVWYGNQGWQMGQVRDMERWQAKQFAVVNIYTNWCDSATIMDNLFGVQLLGIWQNRNVPLISWEPFLCSPEQTPDDVEARAARGAYDAYFGAWAGRLKQFLSGPDGLYDSDDDRRIYLRLGHEMNGDWVPWGAAKGRNSPGDFVKMWKRARTILDGHGLDARHVQWMWCVNHTDNGGFVAEQYFPGDAFVDWVGIDGYNWGETQDWSNWSMPAEIFDDMLRRVRVFSTRPLAIPEYATTSMTTTGADIEAKSRWIADVYRYVAAQDIRMVVWFNEDKETDWAIFGGSRGDTTYDRDSRSAAIAPQPRFQPLQIIGMLLLAAFVVGETLFFLRSSRPVRAFYLSVVAWASWHRRRRQ